MKNNNSFAALLFIVIAGVGGALSFAVSSDMSSTSAQLILILFLLLAVFVAWSTKVASQWNRAVVLRLGKFHSLRGPGIFFIIPIIDTIPYWIDIRVISTILESG
jgi:regulator of protease activity HflC (stomatin/prohibitin superfamily)